MWYRRLKGRNTSFSLRAPEAKETVTHDAMSRVRLANYFSELKNVFELHNFASFPERIWNMDKTGLNVAHKPRQVIAKKGAKSIHGKTSGARETVTVIACGNAAGSYIPPHFIMPGKSKKKLHGYDTQSAGKVLILMCSIFTCEMLHISLCVAICVKMGCEMLHLCENCFIRTGPFGKISKSYM